MERMKTLGGRARAMILGAAVIGSLGIAAPALGHCDTADGPVAVDVHRAIASGDVDGVLKWVEAGDEAEVRDVFERALRVRRTGEEAATVADRLLLETVVRLHRESEGAPYTGIKPGGGQAPPAVVAVDEALAEGSVDALIDRLQRELDRAVRERFERAHGAAERADESVERGRESVRAYVEFVHFVAPLHEMLAGGDGGHGEHAAACGHGGH